MGDAAQPMGRNEQLAIPARVATRALRAERHAINYWATIGPRTHGPEAETTLRGGKETSMNFKLLATITIFVMPSLFAPSAAAAAA